MSETRALTRLAGPLILSSIGTTLLTSVDVFLVGPLGKGALGAVALGSGYATVVTLLAMMVLGPLDAMVSGAIGEKKPEDAGRFLRAGVVVGLALSIPVVLLLRVPEPVIRLLAGHGADAPALVAGASDYSRALSWGAPFLIVFTALRCFVDGHSRPVPGSAILLAANLLNAAGDLALIYGHVGLPALGATGSAYSTSLVEVAICAAMAIFILRDPALRGAAALHRLATVDRPAVRSILRLGLPIGLMEGARMAVPTILAGMMERFGTASLAANEIALSLFFLGHMVPLGMCWALGIRIAWHVGRDDRDGARLSLRAGYVVGLSFAAVVSAVYLCFGAAIMRRYSADPAIVETGARLLRAFAVMQLASAAASITIGGLFGLLDMRFLARANVLVLYVFGLPLAWLLAFGLGLGPVALWLGPSAAQLLLAAICLARFRRRLAQPQLRPATAAS